MKCYAAYNNEYDIRIDSSSGAVFSALSECFEIVYGVCISENCYSANFIRVVDGDISSLRGSKYLQAVVGDIFKQVKKDLNIGKKVLFSGTGCQINGLKCYLQKDYLNLTTVDVICHGVPSPKLWRAYVNNQEKKNGKLYNINFRSKDDSWQNFGMKENHLYISFNENSFMRMFLRNYCLRPSCYECHAKFNKMSDVSIADFWGIEKVAPEMNDGKGTSLVIVRTDKGQKLFDEIKVKLRYKEVLYEEGIRGNPAEYRSCVRPPQRDTFFEDLSKLSFEEMERKYAADIKVSLIRKVVRRIKHGVKKILSM